MRKRVIAVGTIVLGIVLGCVITLRAADDLDLVRPAPICYDDPLLENPHGTCKTLITGGSVCVVPEEGDRPNCNSDSYSID